MLAERRWGEYPAYAAATGTHSSLSLPIAPRTHTAGALNMYASASEGFADADLASLRSIAAQATGAVALARRMADVRMFDEGPLTALKFRAVIDQPIDVVMAQQHCSLDEAFEILRSASQHRNVKLRDLCATCAPNRSARSATRRNRRILRPLLNGLVLCRGRSLFRFCCTGSRTAEDRSSRLVMA